MSKFDEPSACNSERSELNNKSLLACLNAADYQERPQLKSPSLSLSEITSVYNTGPLVPSLEIFTSEKSSLPQKPEDKNVVQPENLKEVKIAAAVPEVDGKEFNNFVNYQPKDPHYIPDEDLRKLIVTALHLEHEPATAENVDKMMQLIHNESTNNPLVRNDDPNDPNAKRYFETGIDERSRGLCQLTPSTFEAYKDPRIHSGILNPAANICGSLRYIQNTYGHDKNGNLVIPVHGY